MLLSLSVARHEHYLFPGRNKECQTQPEPSAVEDRGWHACPKTKPKDFSEVTDSFKRGQCQERAVLHPPRQQFSRWMESLTHSLSITWELVTNMNLKLHPDLLTVVLWGPGGAVWVLTSLPGAHDACSTWIPPAFRQPDRILRMLIGLGALRNLHWAPRDDPHQNGNGGSAPETPCSHAQGTRH